MRYRGCAHVDLLVLYGGICAERYATSPFPHHIPSFYRAARSGSAVPRHQLLWRVRVLSGLQKLATVISSPRLLQAPRKDSYLNLKECAPSFYSDGRSAPATPSTSPRYTTGAREPFIPAFTARCPPSRRHAPDHKGPRRGRSARDCCRSSPSDAGAIYLQELSVRQRASRSAGKFRVQP